MFGTDNKDVSLALEPHESVVALPSRRQDLRNALLCALAVVLAVFITNPFCESPFNDDFSYSATVRKLLLTGKLTYNGWASASLIAQAYWGLLWVKVFGFSYTVLRFSTLPLAAAAISLCYLLARRVGLIPKFAVFAALSVGLCPLYPPVAGSFMTDAPGLFCILLSLYLLARSIDAPNLAAAIAWLAAGLVVGLVGGTGRQIVWVVPLIVAPYAAWLRRDSLTYVCLALLGSALVLSGALITLHWFSHQPYSIPEISLLTEVKSAAAHKTHYVLNVLGIGLTTLWMILPSLWGKWRRWSTARAALGFILLVCVLILVKVRPHYSLAPWMGNTLSYQGVMGGAEIAGIRPIAMPKVVRAVFAIVVYLAACCMVADLLIWLARPLTACRKTVQFLFYPKPGQALLPAMTLFALAYLTLLLPRAASNMVYDRYILVLMPCAIFPILLGYQRQGERKIATSAWVLFSIYAAYGIAITQDITALDRARAAACNKLIAAGIPRVRIDAGFEYDCETQILAQGYINDPRIKIPANAYKKEFGPTYRVQAIYRPELNLSSDTSKTPFGSISYTSFIYPFHRTIYIDKYTDPWWLDRKRAATHPSDKWHQIMPSDSDDANEK